MCVCFVTVLGQSESVIFDVCRRQREFLGGSVSARFPEKAIAPLCSLSRPTKAVIPHSYMFRLDLYLGFAQTAYIIYAKFAMFAIEQLVFELQPV